MREDDWRTEKAKKRCSTSDDMKCEKHHEQERRITRSNRKERQDIVMRKKVKKKAQLLIPLTSSDWSLPPVCM